MATRCADTDNHGTRVRLYAFRTTDNSSFVRQSTRSATCISNTVGRKGKCLCVPHFSTNFKTHSSLRYLANYTGDGRRNSRRYPTSAIFYKIPSTTEMTWVFRKNWPVLIFTKIHSELLKLLHEYWWTRLNRHSTVMSTHLKNGFSGKERESPNTKSRTHESTATCAVHLSTNAGRSTTENRASHTVRLTALHFLV